MNILMLNTFDTDGGAAIATYRLHQALKNVGVNSRLLVQQSKTSDYTVIVPVEKWKIILAFLRPYMDGVFTKLYRKRPKVLFSPAWLPEKLASKIAKLNPDIVHLFWINGGFMRIESLKKIKQPIIWTLHDMWPFTGGCHYDDECRGFQKDCGSCPALNSKCQHDLSGNILQRKKKSWNRIPITIVATSNWLADMARSSSLFKNYRIEVIPNAIDTDIYKPVSKQVARAAYNLPQDKQLILFSAFNAATDKRKGSQFLMESLRIMSESDWGNQVELVILGAAHPETSPDFGMKVHYIGNLHDSISQVMLYSAVDVVVSPSMQENLSNTVMESLSCGTPVVAFDIGGMPDMINHKFNGYLAKPFNPIDLADGLIWALENVNQNDTVSKNARQSVLERYTLNIIANRYTALYQSVLTDFNIHN